MGNKLDNTILVNNIETDDSSAKKNRGNSLADFIIAVGIGLVISGSYTFLALRGNSRPVVYHICNGLFIASVFLLGCGGLSLVNKAGFFNIFQFGIKQVKETIKYGMTMNRDARVDTDYQGFQQEKRLKRKGRWSWVLAGCLYFIAAFVVLQFV